MDLESSDSESRDRTGLRDATFWKATRMGAACCTILFFAVSGSLLRTELGSFIGGLIGALVGISAINAFSLFFRWLSRLLRPLPRDILLGLAAVLAALFFLIETRFLSGLPRIVFGLWEWRPALPSPLSWQVLLLLVSSAAVLIGLTVTTGQGSLRGAALARKGVFAGLFLLSLGAIFFALASLYRDGSDPYPTDFRTLSGNLPAPLEVADPSRHGNYEVEVLTYGIAPNHRRPEFGEKADLESRTVDGTKLLRDWKGVRKRFRESYWGFGLSKAPLNGRVWTPAGAGPFPLVLIVHGNHAMEDYSDPGYAYLGELLASRGYIAVSVDQNYINGTWSGDFGGTEMPVRAWLLLEHLRLWRDWNGEGAHRFAGRVDMNNIGLIGHSRGGEAISIAAAYNRLPFYPDDATLSFDFGFSIRALVAIAQIDRRYHRRVHLDNVNFLTLHGSYDADEPAYHGFRQYNRIRFTDGEYWFKTGVYIHRANHGQFNSGWGRFDSSPPGAWTLNVEPIIPGDQQRQIAKVYVSAFLDASLRKDHRYLPMFTDSRKAAQWLPDQIYLTQFTDSMFKPVADFEEDLDVTTGTLAGANLSSQNLALWREEDLLHRDDLKQGTSVVVLGWNGSRDTGKDPTFTVQLPEETEFRGNLGSQDSVLSFSVSGSTERVPSRTQGETSDASEDSGSTRGDLETPRSPGFTVELVDQDGRAAGIIHHEGAFVAPPLRVRYLKSKRSNRQSYRRTWEPVLQTYEIRMADFGSRNPDLDLSRIREIRFRFDQSEQGVLILDNIGFRRTVRQGRAEVDGGQEEPQE